MTLICAIQCSISVDEWTLFDFSYNRFHGFSRSSDDNLMVRRFIYIRAEWLAFLGAFMAALGSLLVSLKLPLVDFMVGELGIDSDIRKGIAGSLIAAMIASLCSPAFATRLRRFLRTVALPVNTHLSPEHLAICTKYGLNVLKRLSTLMPKEIRDAWISGYEAEFFLLPVSAEELPTPEVSGPLRRNITNLLTALDLALFQDKERLGRPVTLQGEPGSGKSTVLFELYRLQLARLQRYKHGWIPVLISAHEISRQMIDQCQSLSQFVETLVSDAVTDQDLSTEFANIIDLHFSDYRFLFGSSA
jgi:hypothetical protein